MDLRSKTRIMRIYLSSTYKFKNAPLFETLVFLAKRNKMAGATVLKGVMGFGASSAVTSTRFWSVSEKLPMIIEIIDEKEKIEDFFKVIKPYLEKVKKGIMVSVENAEVVMYKSGGQ
jgi:uncharacterized protein